MPQQSHRIAVFGGTFDPPHNGHILLAEQVLKGNYADEILFIPALQPPHKPGTPSASFEDRLKMVQYAVHDLKQKKENLSSVSDIEGSRPGSPSYTYDTMIELSKLYPESELSLLIGGDSLLHLHTWYKADELIKNWKLLTYPRDSILFQRETFLKELQKKWNESIASSLFQSILPFDVCNISSTKIRKKLKDNQDALSFLDPDVYQYIKEKGLYQRD